MTTPIRTLSLAALLMGGAALPALAQAGLCGGVGDTGQWLGGEETASDIATAASHLEQMALVLQNTEYVGLFSLSAAGEVRIEAQARGTGDTVIDIRDAAGNIVGSDDDSGGNGASRVETYLDSGTYCLSMRSYDGAPLTGNVRVGRPEHEPLTVGLAGPIEDPPFDDPMLSGTCDSATMRDIGEGAPIDGRLGDGGVVATASQSEVPYWGFSITEPQALTITAENESADPYITLYGPYGEYLNENDDFNGLNAQLDMTYPLEPGSYCLSMTALSDTSLPITLTVRAYDPAEALLGMYSRAEASPPMDGSYPVEMLGTLSSRLRKDLQTTEEATWFSVEVPEGGLLMIEAITNGMGDPVLVLFDDFGRQIAYNDDAGDTLDSMIAARLLPGTYMVAVRQLNAGPPVLTRMLFERYVPAK